MEHIVGTKKNGVFALRSLVVQLLFISIGVMGAALGCALFLHADLGSDPVTAFVQGLGISLHISTGMATNILNATAFIVLLVLNRSLIHLGTAVYTLTLGSFVDLFYSWINASVGPAPALWLRILFVLAGTLGIGIGLGLYQSAELGVGPTDGVNQTIVKRTGISYRVERMLFDVLMALFGWMLGGKVWLGTIVGALAVGPVMVPSISHGKRILAKFLPG